MTGSSVTISVDPWTSAFGGSGPSTAELPEAPGATDVTPEVPEHDWAPIHPTSRTCDDIVFVDGVRRIDARVWVSDGATSRLGFAASYAAGAIRCQGGSRQPVASVERLEVERRLFGPPGTPDLAAGGVRYRAAPVAGDDDESLLADLGDRLRTLENQVARAGWDAELIVLDGPLRGRQDVPAAVGYVKTHQVGYLDGACRDVVAQLGPGERTPVFLTTSTWSRFSWYLRLPGPGGHPWAGIVRCEVSADRRVEEAVDMADATATTLPRFASHAHREKRAPQNLTPIAALEQQLRHRLGDVNVLERALRRGASL